MIKTKTAPFLGVLVFLIFITCFSFTNRASTNTVQKPDSVKAQFVHDDPILSMIDSLLFFSKNGKSDLYNEKDYVYDYQKDYNPYYPDQVYINRLARLDSMTPFKLVYNQYVRAYIDVYTVQRRQRACEMLGLAEYYFPLFEQILDKFNMPLELKYLAVIESALNPTARSKAGAVGLWQFIYTTGKQYKLEINSYVDERHDPYKETVVACQYLSLLYSIYKDWNLALAAYNTGPGNINKAIRRAGGEKDYWKILPYLPQETRGYVPAFIAANYFMAYSKEHNLKMIKAPFSFYNTDTIHVRKPISFEQISSVLNIPTDVIKYLNPTYRKNIIPCTSKENILILPNKDVVNFINNEETIYNINGGLNSNLAIVDGDGQNATASSKNKNTHSKEDAIIIYHKVKSGESLVEIAEKYKIGVGDLKKWNKLKTNKTALGQKLVIHKTVETKKPIAETHTNSIEANSKKANSETKDSGYYTVQKGDTLWSIASRYEGMTVSELKAMNNISNESDLKPGTRLKVAH